MVDASLRATILDSLSELNRDYGISIIYITHDLTTAYQISDNIIVLYRGSVAEAGSVELAVKDPCHPYTQLLVGSIPAARSGPSLAGPREHGRGRRPGGRERRRGERQWRRAGRGQRRRCRHAAHEGQRDGSATCASAARSPTAART